MRQISRNRTALLVSCLALGMPLLAHGQSSTSGKSGKSQPSTTKPAAGTKQPPTKTAAADNTTTKAAGGSKKNSSDEPLTDEEKKKLQQAKLLEKQLNELLEQWELHSAKIKYIHGKQTRSEFNQVFEVERKSEGEFFLETPDKGRIDMKAAKIAKNAVSRMKNKDDKPFSLESGQSETWICTGEEIIVIDEDEETYQTQMIPENQRGTNIVHSPLPFLFGMKVEEAKTRFKLKLAFIAPAKNTATIEVIPLMEKDRQNYEIAWVQLDTKTYLPKVVRLLNDQIEIIYFFDKIEVVTDKKSYWTIVKEKWKGDPFHPSYLKKYKKVVSPTQVAGEPKDPDDDKLEIPSKEVKPAKGEKPSGSKSTPPNSKSGSGSSSSKR